MVFDTVDSWLAVQPAPKQLIWALPQPINGDLFGCSENCCFSVAISLAFHFFAKNLQKPRCGPSACYWEKSHCSWRFRSICDISTQMFVTQSNWNLSISLHASFEGRDKWPAGGLRSLKQVDLIWHLDICNSVASFRTLFSLLWLAVCCCSCRERLLDVKQEAILSWFLKNAPAGLLLLLLLFLKVPVGRHALPRCIHPSNWSYFSEIILKVINSEALGHCERGKPGKVSSFCLPGYAISCKVQPCGRAQCLGQGQEDVRRWLEYVYQKWNHLCLTNLPKGRRFWSKLPGVDLFQRARTSQRQPWQSPVVPIGDRLREVSLHCLSRHSHLEYSPCYRYLLYTSRCGDVWLALVKAEAYYFSFAWDRSPTPHSRMYYRGRIVAATNDAESQWITHELTFVLRTFTMPSWVFLLRWGLPWEHCFSPCWV